MSRKSNEVLAYDYIRHANANHLFLTLLYNTTYLLNTDIKEFQIQHLICTYFFFLLLNLVLQTNVSSNEFVNLSLNVRDSNLMDITCYKQKVND